MKRSAIGGLAIFFSTLLAASSGGATHADPRWVITDLGALDTTTSEALAINERAQVVGYSETPTGNANAFLWQNGKMISLGDLGNSSVALDINERTQVVGYGDTAFPAPETEEQ